MNKLFHLDVAKLLNSKVIVRTVTFIAFYVIVFTVLSFSSYPHKYSLKEHDIAASDIYAPWDIVDKTATELRKKQAEDSVQPVYKLDLTVQIEIEKKIDYFFNVLYTIKNNEASEPEQKLNTIKQQSNIDLDDKEYTTLLKSSDDDLKQLKENIKYIINQVLNERFTEKELNVKRNNISEFFSKLPRKNKLNDIGAQLAVIIIKPNMFYDENVTNEMIEEARSQVEDVIIKKGTRIVNKGEEVSSHHIQLLKAYGLLSNNSRFDLKTFLAFSIIIIICLLIFAIYILTFFRNLWDNSGTIILMSFVICLTLAIAAGIKAISGYLIPLPAAAMLISIFVNPRIAILSNVVLVVFISFITAFDSTVMITMLLSGIVGAILVNKTHHRSTVMFAGLAISFVNALTILSFGMINNMSFAGIVNDGLYGIIGGIFSSVLTIGMLPFFEVTFDLITPIKLLELSNPNQPILRRLLIEAPGTYYHSILVGNLAEAAAEDIGANSLLCRVGAYYHDIGKLKRPYFFKENQITKDNPHDKVTPGLSTTIITSHIKDGIELAKKSKLPSRVIDIINEHHGNTLVAYFYHKALSAEGAENVSEEKFRYKNPKPQSKEAAIVMLADSVEAYIRSLTEPTQDQVEQGVRKIIKDKMQDAQLDECELTLKDMELIVKAFVKVLAGIFHDRIEYPENIKDI